MMRLTTKESRKGGSIRMGTKPMNIFAMTALAAGLLLAAGPASAKPGNAENGLKIYNKRCVWCHGEEGAGGGPAAERLNPPPRDFTSGAYKIKTTNFKGDVPTDDDIYRMIKDGMPGTAMPGWSDVITEQDMWDLVAQLKVFSEYTEEQPGAQVDAGKPVPSSPESIAKGKPLFVDRCVECHGKSGKGMAEKKLKGDAAQERIWPRNLTKSWTFLASNDPKEIFTRISTGIPGTPMPNFADPVSTKKLSVEERWHVANYAASLADPGKTPQADKTVIKASRVESLPTGPTDAAWAAMERVNYYMLPQIIGKTRFFTPSNDSMTVRAAYSAKEIALLLEWDDRTKSLPGDETAKAIADDELFEDAVAVQFPLTIPDGMEKPYFAMGDAANPVNLWQWKSGAAGGKESVALVNAKGAGEVIPRDAAASGLTAQGVYEDGTWKVMMTRSLITADTENDLQIVEGSFIPIAFSAWDGSNSETGSKHTLTTWYWLLLKPDAGSKPFLLGLLFALLVGAGEFWWLKSAQRKLQG